MDNSNQQFSKSNFLIIILNSLITFFAIGVAVHFQDVKLQAVDVKLSNHISESQDQISIDSNMSNTLVSVNNPKTSIVTSMVTDKMGIIEGSLGYPSEGIPLLKVCAEDEKNNQEFCTLSNIEDKKYTYGKGYRLQVPVGEYKVYAQNEENNLKAYYSENVTCGLKVECTSHEPIVINVKENKTVSNIDPQDWYKQ